MTPAARGFGVDARHVTCDALRTPSKPLLELRMQKLRLELEDLAIETFVVDDCADGASPGTVRAHGDGLPQVVKTLPVSACVFSACATCGIYC